MGFPLTSSGYFWFLSFLAEYEIPTFSIAPPGLSSFQIYNHWRLTWGLRIVEQTFAVICDCTVLEKIMLVGRKDILL